MNGPRRRTWPGADLPGRRIFIAAPLPEAAVEAVAAVVDAIRAPGVPGGGRDVRWVRLDGLHLTLRFLGPTLDDRIDAALAATRAAAVAFAGPFDIVIGGGGAFPSIERPRALWLAIDEGAETLGALASEVDRALGDEGWAFEARPFQPHLTLARSDGVPAGGRIAERLVAEARGHRIRTRIERIGLFESLTGGGPARYEPVELIELGG
jgi:RNA 2',3'-cyclic 3'-phosphodiesterase